jgi:hypothetical protein
MAASVSNSFSITTDVERTDQTIDQKSSWDGSLQRLHSELGDLDVKQEEADSDVYSKETFYVRSIPSHFFLRNLIQK